MASRASSILAAVEVVIRNERTDGDLLREFLDAKTEAAFGTLVRRHGPMVSGVCRRILGDADDADDAAQATFLVLATKANSLRSYGALGDWLHGIARRTALNARRSAARRREMEKQSVRPAGLGNKDVADILPILDEELARLPEKYRLPIVLCDLEGQSRKTAAKQLRWPEGTVAGRLARGHELLAQRLTRRGVSLTASALAAALASQTAVASVSLTTVQVAAAAAQFAASGPTAGAGVVSAKVLVLTQGALKSMLLSKLKITTAVCLLAVLAPCGVGVLARKVWSAAQDETTKKPAETLPKPPDGAIEKTEADIAKTAKSPIAGPLRAGPARILVEHKSPVVCLTWSPDGRWVATAAQDDTIHITELATGKEVRSFPAGAAISGLAFSPDGKRIVVSRAGDPTSIWDIDAGKQQVNAGGGGGGGGNKGPVPSAHVAFAADGQSVVCIAVGQMLRAGSKGGGGMMMANPVGDGCAAIAPDCSVGGWRDGKGVLRYFDLTRPITGPSSPRTSEVVESFLGE